jgi:hypothetical protein
VSAAQPPYLSDDRVAYIYLDVDNPLVAWHVYRAAVVTSAVVHESALSLWMTGYLRDLTQGAQRHRRLQIELAIDQLRQTEYLEAVSRLHGFFAFPDEVSAQRAAETWGTRRFDPKYLAEIEILENAKISRHDANWISHEFESSDPSWMHDYLVGKPHGKHPIWEMLVEGEAIVYGTDLRERAYETVRHIWPKALVLLEIARLGVELDSDLGIIVPMLQPTEQGLEVVYCINMEDARDDDFLRRLRQYRDSGGPINWDDLDIGSDHFSVPDLSQEFFRL